MKSFIQRARNAQAITRFFIPVLIAPIIKHYRGPVGILNLEGLI